MSVTFWCPEGKVTHSVWVDCFNCDGSDCYLCKGDGGYWTEASPEVNLSNSSAWMMLPRMGLGNEELCGSLEPNDTILPENKLLALIGVASDSELEKVEEELKNWRSFLPAFTLIDYNDPNYVRMQAVRFVKLFRYAREQGLKVSWG